LRPSVAALAPMMIVVMMTPLLSCSLAVMAFLRDKVLEVILTVLLPLIVMMVIIITKSLLPPYPALSETMRRRYSHRLPSRIASLSDARPVRPVIFLIRRLPSARHLSLSLSLSRLLKQSPRGESICLSVLASQVVRRNCHRESPWAYGLLLRPGSRLP